MLILIESHIPYIKGLLESVASVRYLEPEAFTPEAVAQADALVVRTRTRCDAALLDGSRVRHIATATIGTDHINLDYCRTHGITVSNAAGCNAPAVAQYVLASIATMMRRHGSLQPRDICLGVVGVGHVGSIVARFAEQCGMRVLRCDPPRQQAGHPGPFHSLDTIAKSCNVITFHTPLTRDGDCPTWHLCDARFLQSLRQPLMLVNSARGPVMDTGQVLAYASAHPETALAIDCWEGEPDINRQLMRRALIATPHIAGYSAQGKTRATAMAVEALCRHYGWHISVPQVPATMPAAGARNVSLSKIAASYDPAADTAALKAAPDAFERLRNTYRLRDEVADQGE